MQNNDTKYLVALSFFEGIGPLRFRLLKKYFGSPHAIYRATKDELAKTGLGEKLVANFVIFRQTFDIDGFISNITRRGIGILGEDDARYPDLLRQIPSAPFILYTLGNQTLLSEKLCVAVVGTRKITAYGKEVTRQLVSGLVTEGFTIVSGMAMGVDAMAHRTALELNGKTIAVLGCGVDICYPPINKSIYDRLIKEGLILSEFPPGMRSTRGTFPSRNRIIVGLSLGVLITEGAKDSGAMITARYATEFNRDVFAVPGPITSSFSDATTQLMKEGAKPVACAHDIIEEYKNAYTAEKKKNAAAGIKGLTATEAKIVLEIERNGTLHIDEIARFSDVSTSEVSSIISSLVLKGVLTEMAIGEYTITTF